MARWDSNQISRHQAWCSPPCFIASAGTTLRKQKQLAAEDSRLCHHCKKAAHSIVTSFRSQRDDYFAESYPLNSNFQHLSSLTLNAPSASSEASVARSCVFTVCLPRMLGAAPHNMMYLIEQSAPLPFHKYFLVESNNLTGGITATLVCACVHV